jgi:hypothetical protein
MFPVLVFSRASATWRIQDYECHARKTRDQLALLGSLAPVQWGGRLRGHRVPSTERLMMFWYPDVPTGWAPYRDGYWTRDEPGDGVR